MLRIIISIIIGAIGISLIVTVLCFGGAYYHFNDKSGNTQITKKEVIDSKKTSKKLNKKAKTKAKDKKKTAKKIEEETFVNDITNKLFDSIVSMLPLSKKNLEKFSKLLKERHPTLLHKLKSLDIKSFKFILNNFSLLSEALVNEYAVYNPFSKKLEPKIVEALKLLANEDKVVRENFTDIGREMLRVIDDERNRDVFYNVVAENIETEPLLERVFRQFKRFVGYARV